MDGKTDQYDPIQIDANVEHYENCVCQLHEVLGKLGQQQPDCEVIPPGGHASS